MSATDTEQRVFFEYEFDSGVHHVGFIRTCACGERFQFGEDSVGTLGECALCHARPLHCATAVKIARWTLHVCDACASDGNELHGLWRSVYSE